MRSDYSHIEMMAIACARRITNDDIVFCGTGLPMLAAVSAKKLHAPQCTIFFETGAMDPALLELPLAVGDSRVMYNASYHGGLADAFAYMQNRRTGPSVLGILSGAQIDRYGNINSTSLGDYEEPTVRFPGSGGACDVASFVGRTLIFMKHERRRFVNKVDYLTTPGWFSGGSSREHAGLAKGGPENVITSLGVLSFDYETKLMQLESYYEFTTPEEIQDNTGFPLETSSSIQEAPPTIKELAILREKVDPMKLILN